MFYVALYGHDWKYRLEEITRLFWGEEKPIYTDNNCNDAITLESRVEYKQDGNFVVTALHENDEIIAKTDIFISNEDCVDIIKRTRQEVKRQAYIILSKHFNKEFPWGAHTGIRPAKLVNEMLEKGLEEEAIKQELKTHYLVSEEKTNLAYEVAVNELPILKRSDKNNIGLYIGIPFCPSKCLYCSFTSDSIDKFKNKVDPYIEALRREIEGTASILKELGLGIQSIYMGGGTPTSVNHLQLDRILGYIEQYFNLERLEEFTVEAGRPDSIDLEKLKVLKKHPVDRISINPQTMNKKTLELIGRHHSPEEIENAFYIAREQGFNNINMDLIIGLPEEKLTDFEHTLSKVREMSPENLTVHSLAIKRASRLKEKQDQYDLVNDQAEAMLKASYKAAKDMDMHPYYLYRQKYMVGDLENTGYSKKGFESNYNVQIMEETQTIFALGAGAVTKSIFYENNRIERAGNVKNVDEYILRVDEMIKRKEELFLNQSF